MFRLTGQPSSSQIAAALQAEKEFVERCCKRSKWCKRSNNGVCGKGCFSEGVVNRAKNEKKKYTGAFENGRGEGIAWGLQQKIHPRGRGSTKGLSREHKVFADLASGHCVNKYFNRGGRRNRAFPVPTLESLDFKSPPPCE